ncbi:mitochondrial acyl carrier protein [Scheffersomyces coipomensis]|uniref:mitochondrial acyl carrier protein n=1 Tax=Scheffersomyces coipomensis TaxID=1788519 RepID=UPI00315DE2C2
MFRLALRSTVAPVSRLALASKSMVTPIRFYAAAPLTKEEVTQRAFEALKTVAAVQESKLSLEATFKQDLGLDSLDVIETLVALEEEFDLEIPDKISDEIKTVGEAIDYIFEEEQKL